jgi:activator of Hsp90 ATPase-like protein
VSPGGAIMRTVDVDVDPATAFEVFTEEIGRWYRSGPYSWNDPERAVGIRFEPGVGGRLIEVHDEATGEGFEMGRVLAWEPGSRLVCAFRSVFFPPEPLTEVEVRFEERDGATRVTLEHRGLDRLPPDFVKTIEDRAWITFMGWFGEYVADLNRARGR